MSAADDEAGFSGKSDSNHVARSSHTPDAVLRWTRVHQAEGHEKELAELFTYARDTVQNAEVPLKRYGPLNAALRILQVRRRGLPLSLAQLAHRRIDVPIVILQDALARSSTFRNPSYVCKPLDLSFRKPAPSCCRCKQPASRRCCWRMYTTCITCWKSSQRCASPMAMLASGRTHALPSRRCSMRCALGLTCVWVPSALDQAVLSVACPHMMLRHLASCSQRKVDPAPSLHH